MADVFCERQANGRVVVAGRLAWPDLIVPTDGGTPGSALKFRLSLLIPKGTDITPLKELEASTATEKHGDDWVKKLSRSPNGAQHRPIHSLADNKWLTEAITPGDFLPDYIKATQPGAGGRNGNGWPPAIYEADQSVYSGDGKDIYSGRWVRVAIDAYADTKPSKYVKFGCKVIQLLDHDTKLVLGKGEDPFDGMVKSERKQPTDADSIWQNA